jgi:hypothetical protein
VAKRSEEQEERHDRADEDDADQERPDRQRGGEDGAVEADSVVQILRRERPPRLEQGPEEGGEGEAQREQRDRVPSGDGVFASRM